jgi:hypothetical protein
VFDELDTPRRTPGVVWLGSAPTRGVSRGRRLAALSVNVPRRIARDIFERNLEDRREQFCRSLLLIAFRVFLAGVLHRANYRLKLQRARIGGSMHGDLTCALRARC